MRFAPVDLTFTLLARRLRARDGEPGARGGTRTHTGLAPHRLLKPTRKPFRHPGLRIDAKRAEPASERQRGRDTAQRVHLWRAHGTRDRVPTLERGPAAGPDRPRPDHVRRAL